MKPHPPDPKPATKQKKRGDWAEALALAHLSQQGLQLYQRNYQCKTGEIDLIMKDQDTLVFVEVRFRSDSTRGSPLETVTVSKQKKIIRTASFFLQQHYGDRWPACRFDVVGILKKKTCETEINWIKSAFY